MTVQSMNIRVLGAILLAVVCLAGTRGDTAEPLMTDVFVSGTDGYHTYCIPSLICTPKGTLLAFCEGRKFWSTDESPTDLVLKRSFDGGKTWGPMQVIVKAVPEAAADATPVIDRTTGTVILVYDLWPELVKDQWKAEYMYRASGLGRDSVTAWVMTSGDEGATWSAPVNITAMTKKAEWSRIVHGPGVGIQTRAGRLVIPCWRSDSGGSNTMNFVIYSDDHGQTWQLSDNDVGPGVDESQVVELADGTLLLNMRSTSVKGCRVGATSQDGGNTWSKPFDISELPDPCCQGSILRYTWADQHGKSRILFSNPATKQGRHTGTVRLSYDEGKTWPVAKVINKETFAYSCLTVMPDGTIGCLFDHADWSRIKYAGFSLDWLTDGKDSLKP